ncbi:unnamed protein product [Leptosia nina]|uniref:Uncharacterized protein n=1 Tax=Leptosia nina TaxID=320188 RepID=A0AAV1J8M7_9NEOP
MWRRMAFLHENLVPKLTEDTDVEEKMLCLRKFLHVYKTLLDNVDMIYKTLVMLKMQPLSLMILSCAAIDFTVLSWGPIFLEMTQNECEKIKAAISSELIVKRDFAALSVGTIFLEKTLKEHEDMKSAISAELMVFKDTQTYTCLEFLDIRPPSSTIWHILPMNF